jgi:hypothetical protein
VSEHRTSGRPDERFPQLSVTWQGVDAEPRVISVVGTVNLTKREGRIAFVNPVPNVRASPLESESPVVLRVKRDDDAVLGDFPVPVKLSSELSPGDDRTGVVDAVIPAPSNATIIELVIDGHVANTFQAGAPPPVVRAVQPVAMNGKELRIGVEFDRELEERHTYAVQITTDNGATWQTVGVGLRDVPFTLDRRQLGDEVQVRILTTNGFSTAMVTSEPIRISTLNLRC